MNVQLANVISDITGVTGQKIVRAIIAGERDPAQLAKLRHERIRASEGDIARSLQGNWRDEHLFALQQAMELHDAYQKALDACAVKIQGQLERLYRHDAPEPSRRRQSKAPAFDLRVALQRTCGVDLTRINGIDTTTALKVLAEVGPDLSRFKSPKHFASWLGLCPGTKISGGKVLSGSTKRTANRLAQALRMAAFSLSRSQSALGAYYRRLSGRLDKPKAITATAHQLARLIYSMLTKGTEFVDRGQDYYEERYRQRVVHHLNRRATALGFTLTPIAPVSA
jgi:transposase